MYLKCICLFRSLYSLQNFPPNISCQVRCPHIDIVLFSSIFTIIFKIPKIARFALIRSGVYIEIQNPTQMSSLRSGVYNITGKNKIGTRIVYNIFWLDEPVQVSILYANLPPKCPLSVQVSIYRHRGSGTDENPCVRLFLFFEKICLCPFRCL